MVEENLMKTIIRTFVDHLRHRDLHGCFQFDRYTAQQAFKFGRVQSLIGDLKWGTAHRLFCSAWYCSYIWKFLYRVQVRPDQSSIWLDRSAQNQVSGRSRCFSGAAQVYAGNTAEDPLPCTGRWGELECIHLTDVLSLRGWTRCWDKWDST